MTLASVSSESSSPLAEKFRQLKTDNSKLRIRDAASRLGVSEAELVACDLNDQIFALANDPRTILSGMDKVGRVMCLSRNECAVHERHGAFEDIRIKGPIGLVLGPDIDLRLFFHEWQSAFYLVQELASGTRESIQFFDVSGQAVLKIYATGETDLAAFRALANASRLYSDSTLDLVPGRRTAPAASNNFEPRSLRQAWSELRDTHDFFKLLKTFDADRITALRSVGSPYAEELPLDAVAEVMALACERNLPIMVFVNNPGCIQIHSGAVSYYKPLGKWLNILDPTFNLHLDSAQFSSCWRVRKPSADGIVTSLEVMDRNQNLCVQFFGARKPGIPERRDWTQLMDSLQVSKPAEASL